MGKVLDELNGDVEGVTDKETEGVAAGAGAGVGVFESVI